MSSDFTTSQRNRLTPFQIQWNRSESIKMTKNIFILLKNDQNLVNLIAIFLLDFNHFWCIFDHFWCIFDHFWCILTFFDLLLKNGQIWLKIGQLKPKSDFNCNHGFQIGRITSFVRDWIRFQIVYNSITNHLSLMNNRLHMLI